VAGWITIRPTFKSCTRFDSINELMSRSSQGRESSIISISHFKGPVPVHQLKAQAELFEHY